MSEAGSCDLCNAPIDEGGGYLFYSTTNLPGSFNAVGLLHICVDCAEKYMTVHHFTWPIGTVTLSGPGSPTRLEDRFKLMCLVNAHGAIAVCKSHGFTPDQAKSKARELSELFWQDRAQGEREATSFWTSRMQPGRVSEGEEKPIGRGCFIVTACCGGASHPTVRFLSDFRDARLAATAVGRAIIGLYGRFSPPVANWVARTECRKQVTRLGIVFPLVVLARLWSQLPWWHSPRRPLARTSESMRKCWESGDAGPSNG